MAKSDAELMAFAEVLDELARVAEDMPPDVASVEAESESNLVEPFLKALGYRGFTQMRKRFGPAEWNNKKVDYALLGSNGEPLILIECKSLSTTLVVEHWQQLREYYNDTEAKVGILTTGKTYRVYLDDDDELRGMNREPSFEFVLGEMDELALRAASRLTRIEDGGIDLEGFKEGVDTWRSTNIYKPAATQIFESWLTQQDEELVTLLEKRLGAPKGSLGELTQEWFMEFVGIHRKTAKHPSTTTASIDTVPLPDWHPMTGERLPVEVVFPDSSRARIKWGYDVVVESTRWLIEKGHLTRDSLPIQRAGKYLVSETRTHPNGDPMRNAKEVPGVFVETAYSNSNNVRNAEFIITHVRQNPAEFKARFS